MLTSRQIIDFTRDPEPGYQQLWEGLKIAGLDPAHHFIWDTGRSPYPGMMAFEEADAAVFFGREAEIQQGLEILQRLRRFCGARMLMVLGASGTGKSSVVRAGFLSRLRRNPEEWLILDPFRPQTHPVRELSIPVRLMADAGWVTWLRDPQDWFEQRITNSFTIARADVATVQDDGWELPATPDLRKGVFATFELEEQVVGWPQFTIDAPEGTIIELMVQESHDPDKGPLWLDTHFYAWTRLDRKSVV